MYILEQINKFKSSSLVSAQFDSKYILIDACWQVIIYKIRHQETNQALFNKISKDFLHLCHN